MFSVGLCSLGVPGNIISQFALTSDSLIEIFEGRHEWLNVVNQLEYDQLLVLWGRGFRRWLRSNRYVLRLIYRWAKLYQAKLFSLYADVSTFGSWFVGFRNTVSKFEIRKEACNIMINNPFSIGGGGSRESDCDSRFVFASFEEELPKKDDALVFPIPTLLEQESLVIGLEGVPKTTAVVSAAPVSGSEGVVLLRTTRRILKLLGRTGCSGRVGDCNNMIRGGAGKFETVVERDGIGNQCLNWFPEVSDRHISELAIQASACGGVKVSRFVCRWHVKDFFKTDPISRNSKMLSRASSSFYEGKHFIHFFD